MDYQVVRNPLVVSMVEPIPDENPFESKVIDEEVRPENDVELVETQKADVVSDNGPRELEIDESVHGRLEKPGLSIQELEISAKEIVKKSIAIVQDDPNIGKELETDFHQYLLAKKVEEIKLLNPELIEVSQHLKDERVETFRTAYGTTHVKLSLGNGKIVCFEAPNDVGSAIGFSVLTSMWKFSKCK